jgi:hypothetical protein
MSTYRIQATSVEAPQFSGSFIGDGSGLTGVGAGSAFPFTGAAQITGSLAVSSSTGITITGGGKLSLGAVGGDEGGEILLGKPLTNTSLTGSGVVIDIYQNKLRFFEEGGNIRGGYFDITTLAGGVGSNLAEPLVFSAPLASIASGGTAAETTITSFSIPAGVLKTGDNILYTVWGNRTSGAATGVNSTLNSRVTDINGSLIFGAATGNRHHNYTLTGRVISDTSIVWWQNSPTTAAVSTTVPSLASSGFTINLSVVRNANTDTFTLYNAVLRKYN